MDSDSAGLRPQEPEAFLQAPFNERMPAFSPDGRWLAYASDESGTFQVYVRAFPGDGSRLQISNSDGSQPVWSPNAHELFSPGRRAEDYGCTLYNPRRHPHPG